MTDITNHPARLPGHWNTKAAADMAEMYRHMNRANLAYGQISDFGLARFH